MSGDSCLQQHHTKAGSQPPPSLVTCPKTKASSDGGAVGLGNKYVRLNVGGTLFYTTLQVLTKQDSMLKAMFSGKKAVFTDKEGWILIDRSGKHFGTVLSYLREGTVTLGKGKQAVLELLAEAKYYLIQGLVELCQNNLQAKLNSHRRYRLKRRAHTDPAVLEDHQIKRQMLDLLRESERNRTERFNRLADSAATVASTINQGFALLRQLLTRQQPRIDEYFWESPLALNDDKEPALCVIPVVTSVKEEERLIQACAKPVVKLVYNRSNNKYSYTSNSDDNLLKNIELFDRLSLSHNGRVLFIKDVIGDEICCWSFYGQGRKLAEVCCTSIVYATEKKQTKVEFPEARVYEETLNALLYETLPVPDNSLLEATRHHHAHCGSHSEEDEGPGPGAEVRERVRRIHVKRYSTYDDRPLGH